MALKEPSGASKDILIEVEKIFTHRKAAILSYNITIGVPSKDVFTMQFDEELMELIGKYIAKYKQSEYIDQLILDIKDQHEENNKSAPNRKRG